VAPSARRHRALDPISRHAPLPCAGRIELPRRSSPAVSWAGRGKENPWNIRRRRAWTGPGTRVSRPLVVRDPRFAWSRVRRAVLVGRGPPTTDSARIRQRGGRAAEPRRQPLRSVASWATGRDLHRRPCSPSPGNEFVYQVLAPQLDLGLEARSRQVVRDVRPLLHNTSNDTRLSSGALRPHPTLTARLRAEPHAFRLRAGQRSGRSPITDPATWAHNQV